MFFSTVGFVLLESPSAEEFSIAVWTDVGSSIAIDLSHILFI